MIYKGESLFSHKVLYSSLKSRYLIFNIPVLVPRVFSGQMKTGLKNFLFKNPD
jgi:hypothetical protein